MISDNPLIAWSFSHFRQQRRALAILIGGLLVFYGVVALTGFWWASMTRVRGADVEELFTILHYEAWSANALVLLLVGPLILSQSLAHAKDKGALDMLRLTGLDGLELAIGFVGTSLTPALFFFLGTVPVVLLGLGGQGGVEAVIRGYLGLALLAPVYVLMGGIVGLAVKKAQTAGGTALVVSIALLAGTATTVWTGSVRGFALLGPWGPCLSTVVPPNDECFHRVDLASWGRVPGELLTLPLLPLLALALLVSLGRRLSGREPAVLTGRLGAEALLLITVVLSIVTFHPEPWDDLVRLDPPVELYLHMLVPWVVSILVALEAPFLPRDLLRGAARRDPDDLPLPGEVFSPWRYAFVPLALLALGLGHVPMLDRGYLPIQAPLLAAAVGIAAWCFAAAVFQATVLLTRGKGSPRVLGAVVLGLVWLGPFLGGAGFLVLIDSYDPLRVLSALNPGYAIFLCTAADSVGFGAGVGGVDPSALAMANVILHTLGAIGIGALVGKALRKTEERAASMVPLPADAEASPGSLPQRCPVGHVYAGHWATCPHCDEAEGTSQEPQAGSSSTRS